MSGRAAVVRLARAGLALLALAALAAPFALSWRLFQHLRSVTGQQDVVAAPLRPDVAAGWRHLAAGLPDRAAPVILSYHDIRPGDGGPYTVTPRRFASHLRALRAAGYGTLSAAELVAYARGGPAPPRAVVITFDDGAHGLWSYGDPILARYGMRASAFLITARVGQRRPYYLSWQEIARMAASGRWDFQSHTHDLHTKITTGPGGDTGSPLTNRVYSRGVTESAARYRARVRADFAASFRAFEEHGLPRPVLFSYPFSDATGESFANRLVTRSFPLALRNRAPHPMPPGRRSTIGQQYERLEVMATTTADALVREVIRRTAIPPGGAPLADRGRWTTVGGNPVAPGAFPFTAGRRGTYRYAAYAPYTSADWDDYTVEVRVSRLVPLANTAGLNVRVGGREPVAVRVSAHAVRLVRGRNGGRVLAERPLTPARAHHLRVTVHEGRTTVVVDETVRLSVPGHHGPANTGGIALAAVRDPGQAWPVFSGLRVAPLPAAETAP